MKKIKLTQGKYALVDDEDFEELNKYKWQYHKKPKDKYGYAVSSKHKMHRLIMKAAKGQIVDHINFNGLDNRKENLRLVTASQSARNRRQKNKYGYFGVGKTKDRNGNPSYWIARITDDDGIRRYLGTFPSAEEAARAYDKAVDEICGGIGVKNNV